MFFVLKQIQACLESGLDGVKTDQVLWSNSALLTVAGGSRWSLLFGIVVLNFTEDFGRYTVLLLDLKKQKIPLTKKNIESISDLSRKNMYSCCCIVYVSVIFHMFWVWTFASGQAYLDSLSNLSSSRLFAGL